MNATKAYQRVYGGSDRAAQVNGSKLLSNTMVAAAVAKGTARQLDRAELSAVRVLEELRRHAFGNRVALMRAKTIEELEALPESLQALVTDFEIFDANIRGVRDGKTDRVRRVRTVPKGHALELLAKHFKLLTDVVEVSTTDALFDRLDRGRERNAKRGRE